MSPTSACSPPRTGGWCSTSTTSTRPCPGPFEWDVKRLAASVAVAGRHVGVKPKKIRAATRATVASYRTTIAALARKSPLEVWYARVDVEDLVKSLKGTSLADDAKRAGRSSARATGDVAVGKLTEVVDGRRRFRSAPPLLVPVDEAQHEGITEHAARPVRRRTWGP